VLRILLCRRKHVIYQMTKPLATWLVRAMQLSQSVRVMQWAIRSGWVIELAQRRRRQSNQTAVQREILELLFLVESVDSWVLPLFIDSAIAGLEEVGRTWRGKFLRLIQIRFIGAEFGKIALRSQDNSRQARIADSSSRDAVSFSSACEDSLLFGAWFYLLWRE
jgi:hypothetical protein